MQNTVASKCTTIGYLVFTGNMVCVYDPTSKLLKRYMSRDSTLAIVN